jgi:hypothetical protein
VAAAALLASLGCNEAGDAGKSGAPAASTVAAPKPVPVSRPPVIISHDLFERRWREDGLAAVGKERCWAKLDHPPESATFRVVVAPDGSVSEVEAVGVGPRPGNDELMELHACVAELIRGMRFAAGPGAQSIVQVNRD